MGHPLGLVRLRYPQKAKGIPSLGVVSRNHVGIVDARGGRVRGAGK
jgi:hypothetical protein